VQIPEGFIRYILERLGQQLLDRLEGQERELLVVLDFFLFVLLEPEQVPEQDLREMLAIALRLMDRLGAF
jgi:hypothetical protein